MKIGFLVATVAAVLAEVVEWVDQLNGGVELMLKIAAAGAAIGAAWRWLVGPGYRGTRKAVMWAHGQLEMIGSLDERLEQIEKRLDDGQGHFARLDDAVTSMDAALEVIRDDFTREAREALREGRPIRLTSYGGVERRRPE